MKWKLTPIKLELKVNWKISRNESSFKQNYILSFEGFESEIAPNIRYGETDERVKNEFKELCEMDSVTVLAHWSNSFKNAVNNIFYKKNLETRLKLTGVVRVLTSFSIPIMDPAQVKDYLAKNDQFQIYKLKVSNAESVDLLQEVLKYTSKKVRIDANEGFDSLDSYLKFEQSFRAKNIELVEQPFKKSMIAEYKSLKKISSFPIIADESVEDDFDPFEFKDMFHGVNIKLMKAGGIVSAYNLIQKAKAAELKIMLGCMIESSLGIREAYELAEFADYLDLDGALLLNNDPYEHLFESDKGFLIKKSTL